MFGKNSIENTGSIGVEVGTSPTQFVVAEVADVVGIFDIRRRPVEVADLRPLGETRMEGVGKCGTDVSEVGTDVIVIAESGKRTADAEVDGKRELVIKSLIGGRSVVESPAVDAFAGVFRPVFPVSELFGDVFQVGRVAEGLAEASAAVESVDTAGEHRLAVGVDEVPAS